MANAPLDTMVLAVLNRLPSPSPDGRANVWPWVCGHCGSNRNRPFDTRLNRASQDCDQCGATNAVLDFDAEHARLAGRRHPKGE